MAFPLVHLMVAHRLAKAGGRRGAPDFLLGSVAPDAVHFRNACRGAGMAEIGEKKKATHLCPETDEAWGQITDNDAWLEKIGPLLELGGAFDLGYAAHILTDIHNNRTLWREFRAGHPAEAKKGYQSGYYGDLWRIDAQLKNRNETEEICQLLMRAKPRKYMNLVRKYELARMKRNLLSVYGGGQQAPASPPASEEPPKFVSLGDMMDFVDGAAEFCAGFVF